MHLFNMEYDIKSLPIDDIASLLRLYYDCQKSKSHPEQVKESMQKTGKFNYYLGKNQYSFYSEDAIKIVDLIASKHEPQGKLEMIKDKITKREQHERETLDFVIRELYRQLNDFFISGVNF